MSTTTHLRHRVAALLAIPWLAVTAASASPDTFYVDLLRSGEANRRSGRPEAAVRELRIAAFGLLDEPQLLTEAVAELALAASDSGDAEGFRRAVDRIIDLERLAGTYSTLSGERRRALDERLVAEATAELLSSVPAFEPLRHRRTRDELVALAPDDRIGRLRGLLADDPGRLEWQLMLGRLLVDEGRGDEAIELLEPAVTLDPSNPAIACALERAYLQDRQCASFERLVGCGIPRLPEPEMLLLIDCLIAAERFTEAGSIVVSLDPGRRASRPVRKRERTIARGLPEGAEVSELPERASEPADPPSVPTTRPPAAPSDVPQPGGARAPVTELAALRRQLDGAASAAELIAVLADADRLAQRYPADPEPSWIGGEAAYRGSDWQRAIERLLAHGEPPAERPALLFYLAVAFHESGATDRAAEVLRRAIPRLESTPIVDRYVRAILGHGLPSRG